MHCAVQILCVHKLQYSSSYSPSGAIKLINVSDWLTTHTIQAYQADWVFTLKTKGKYNQGYTGKLSNDSLLGEAKFTNLTFDISPTE